MLPGRDRPARCRIVVRVSFGRRSEAVPFTLMSAVRGTLSFKFLKHSHGKGHVCVWAGRPLDGSRGRGAARRSVDRDGDNSKPGKTKNQATKN